MRLREIVKIISDVNIDECRLIWNNNLDRFENINLFKSYLDVIKSIPIYQEYVTLIEKSSLYETTSDNLNISDRSERNDIYNISNYIYYSSDALNKIATALIDNLNNDTISIKMREVKDIQLLISDLDVISKSISQIIFHKKINGKLEVNSWESGSRWLNIYLGSFLAVSLVGTVAWSGAVVYKKIQEGKIIAEHVRSLSIRNDTIEEISLKQEEAISVLVAEEAKRIQIEYYDEDQDNDNFERLKYSIKMFSELIENGTEIYPALTAPEEVQNLFPDFVHLENILPKIKLLTEKRQRNPDSDSQK